MIDMSHRLLNFRICICYPAACFLMHTMILNVLSHHHCLLCNNFFFWKGNKTSPLNNPMKCMNKTWLTKGGKKKEKTWNASVKSRWHEQEKIILYIGYMQLCLAVGGHYITMDPIYLWDIGCRQLLQKILPWTGETLLSRVVISKALVIWLSWINSRVADWLEVAGQRKLDKHQRTAWHAQVSSWSTLHFDIGPMSCFMFV